MVPKGELEAAKRIISESKATVADLEAKVKAAAAEASQLKGAADKAQAALAKVEKELAQVKASYKMADSEALALRKRVEEAEVKLGELMVHHGAAWLPHWLEERTGRYTAQAHKAAATGYYAAKEATERASVAVRAAWNLHGAPFASQASVVLKDKFTAASSAINKQLEVRGIDLPAYSEVVNSKLKQLITAATASGVGARAMAAVKSARGLAAKHAGVVVSELEAIVVQIGSNYPALSPLTEKPITMFVVYTILCEFILLFEVDAVCGVPAGRLVIPCRSRKSLIVLFSHAVLPVIAVGMPMLAFRRPRPRPTSSQQTGSTGGKGDRKKNKTPARKSR